MREWMLSNARWILAGVAAGLAALGLRAWLQRRHGGREAARHAVRLADDIAVIAETIEGDLGLLASHGSLTALRARCRECRERADDAYQRRNQISKLDPFALEDLVERLHDDHRRIVNLRSEVDLALASSQGKRTRIYKFNRSRFPSSSFPTRPSTLM